MDFPKYDGNIHPDEWINELDNYFKIKLGRFDPENNINYVILLVDSTISLPTEINSLEKLHDALKEDISFTVFKNTKYQ